jgi:hypothetical protein
MIKKNVKNYIAMLVKERHEGVVVVFMAKSWYD